jgi:16S rRNA processing protein RimM
VVEIHSDREERFAPGAELDLVDRTGARRQVRVVRSGPAPTGRRVAFEGFGDRDAAESLRQARLEVARERVPAAPAGQYYEFELIGCRCVDRRDGEVGEVVGLVDSAAGPLVEVARPGGGKVLLPFVDKFLVRVDPAARILEWQLPEGLIEACASRS